MSARHLVVSSGVTSSGLVFQGPGEVEVYDGGTTIGTALFAYKVKYTPYEIVYSGGLAVGTRIHAGYQEVFEGAVSLRTVIFGGYEVVDGVARFTRVSGGLLELFGGVSLRAIVDGGEESVYLSGAAFSTTVSSGSLNVLAGGRAFSTQVLSNASEFVYSGGPFVSAGPAVAQSTQVFQGGTEIILQEGLTIGTVLSGGTELIRAGEASATVILSGGLQTVQGQAVGAVVSSGGEQTIGDYGTASGTVVSPGGVEVVDLLGTAFATTLAGGMLKVSSGGQLMGGLTINGGRAVIIGEVQAGQTVTFVGSGALQLNNISAFGAAISGFTTSRERIDLNGFAFSGSPTVTWTQSGASGTLTVTDGSEAANLTLIGAYGATNFILGDDTRGGTFVTVSQTGAARFAQAAAGTAGGRALAMVPAYRGGPVDASPLVGAVASGR